MSLQFCIGPSGAGKSTYLYETVIRRSAKEPERQFLIVVPDQFTMQIQKELVMRHPGGGIMNIDVLSFGRLSHRVLDDGSPSYPVLDDTGKSLVLRRLAAKMKDDLPVIGGHLKYTGYINEVKSAISEFMQYGIGPDRIDELVDFCKSRGSLYHKMRDLAKMYLAFLEEIGGKFVTTEGRTGLLAQEVRDSSLIRDAVVVFDGFTGFTPIQYSVIEGILEASSEVMVSVIMDTEEDPMADDGEQKLFALSKKTVRHLAGIAERIGIPILPPVLVNGANGNRFGENAPLAHLEKELFRYRNRRFPDKTADVIEIFGAKNIRGEIRHVANTIRRLVRKEGLLYRDIAVVCGNLEAYADDLEAEFALYDIPGYIDMTKGITLNPFIELIRGLYAILRYDFTYEAVLHFLRSGLLDMTRGEVDELENYVLRYGIRGKKAWSQAFVYGGSDETGVARLARANVNRESFMELLQPMLQPAKTVADHIRNLYGFIRQNRIHEKLCAYEARFKEQGNAAAEKEYGQIYRKVMELLDQIMDLVGEEKMNVADFADLLDAGFGEIRIGMIPQNVDRVLVGDMERTRLSEIKVLFFVGVNDGNIPGSSGSGGLISDLDREFLTGGAFEMSPSPRQKMYIQRLYLYMNMTKPSERLYVSYAGVNASGDAIRPAYLIGTLKSLFPMLSVMSENDQLLEDDLEEKRDGMRILADDLRAFAKGEEPAQIFTLKSVLEDTKDGAARLAELAGAAFYRFIDTPLSETIAKALYGDRLTASVSRLEMFAQCGYHYFLQYGLALKEREELSFEENDLGTLFHGTLERFSLLLAEQGISWFSFSKEQGRALLTQALDETAATYGDGILFRTAKYRYVLTRVKRILIRSIFTMQEHLQKGRFEPKHFEISFASIGTPEELDVQLSEKERMHLTGRIDRVDLCEDADKVYVKIIDYKKGNNAVDVAAIYHGLQLQLVVYSDMATKYVKRMHPDKEVVPAAMLYYHVYDPMISEDGPEVDPEKISGMIRDELKMKGLVSDDVKPSFEGTVSKTAFCAGDDLTVISNYVSQKIRSFGQRILSGDINKKPSVYDKKEACEYCPFKAVCGFHAKTPGCEKRNLKKPEDAIERMKEELA
ncbi:MAG: exodeoxyribonuclease V subunit gamma [Lachnospiraceae bacterium]|nr:exodeoxyribonuclease V subunit gamma [Lachnospiraceae bacterium]